MLIISLAFIFLLAWATWVGSILFFSLVVTPTAFASIELEHAGKFIRSIFPRYYLVGYICGLVDLMAGTLLIVAQAWPWKGGLTVLILLLGMIVLTLWARHRLVPQMDVLREELCEARQAEDDESQAVIFGYWQRLHRLNGILNVLLMLLALAVGWVCLSYWLASPMIYPVR